MRRLILCALLVARISAGAQEADLPKIEPMPYAVTFQNLQIASVEVFTAELRALKSPWRELFEGVDEGDRGYVLAPYKELESVETIYSSKETAIVVAVAKRFRTSFCAVIFLLEKRDGSVRIADIIRRTGIGYSAINPPEMLKLEPEKYPHLHFSVYRGGRHYGWVTDDLFIVAPIGKTREVRFKSTLALRGGFAMSPARPWHRFDQDAKLEVHDGRLRIRVTRTWGLDDADRQQRFSVDFPWNARKEKFESAELGRITLREPENWEGTGLPKPPANARKIVP